MSRKKPRPENYHDRRRAPRGRGEGGIYQRADGTWCGQVSLGYDAQGKRIRPTVYGATKKEVLDKIDELRQNARLGQPVEPTKITVKEHFEDWLRTKKPPNTRSGTYALYKNHTENHIIKHLGHVKLKDLDYRMINRMYEMLDEHDLAPRTVYDIASVLRMGLNDAVRKRLILESPAKLAAKRKKGKAEARFMTPEEIKVFAAALSLSNDRFEDAFIVMLNTGLRPGELLGLPWDNVDLEKREMRVAQALHEEEGKVFIDDVKTEASRRTLPLPDVVVQALKRQRIRQKKEQLKAGSRWRLPEVDRRFSPYLVFPNTEGGLMRRTHLASRHLKPLLWKSTLVRVSMRHDLDPKVLLELYKESGGGVIQNGSKLRLGKRVYEVEPGDVMDDITLHTFRHTYASILFASGLDLDTIAAMLGHEDGSITLQIYAHMMPGRDREAAKAIDRFAASLAVDWQ